MVRPADLHASTYIGPILEMVTKRRGRVKNQLWLDTKRVELSFQIPLAEIIVDFYNELKARTRGYASMDYSLDAYQASDMVKLDVLVNGLSVTPSVSSPIATTPSPKGSAW